MRSLHERGVDFVKLQPRIDRDVVEAVIDEARSLGLTVVGPAAHSTRSQNAFR